MDVVSVIKIELVEGDSLLIYLSDNLIIQKEVYQVMFKRSVLTYLLNNIIKVNLS